MGGGIIQLSGNSKPNSSYLTGNPSITFFKSVYRKHTNFSIEQKKISWVTNPSNEHLQIQTPITRDGDLISKIWITSHFPKITNTNIDPTPTFTSWCNNTGHAYIKECTLLIGGQTIDKHNSMYLDLYNEFTDIEEKEHIGINKHKTNLYMKTGNSNIAPELQLVIPLKFFFNKEYKYSLPLIALQYHNVELKFVFRKLNNLLVSDRKLKTTDIKNPTTELWGEYIFLDEEERRKISQSSHDILIEQTQILHPHTLDKSNELHFNHPVKQLIWVSTYSNRFTETDITINVANPSKFSSKKYDDDGNLVNGVETEGGNDYFNYQVHATNDNSITQEKSGSSIYLNKNLEHFDTCKILLNGHDRLQPQKSFFYKYLQPLYHNKRIPTKTIYTYNFGILTNDYDPSGTCNFSSFETAHLEFNSIGIDKSDSRKLYVFAINYNILKIQSGMGGLVYAN